MKTKFYLLLFLTFSQFIYGQKVQEKIVNIPVEKDSIYGTLLIPESKEKPTLIILIAGSGPTDRNGNQGFIQNNSLKFLAESLSESGFATYRFDQSVISQSKLPGFKEENYTFTGLVDEIKSIVSHFKSKESFPRIVIAGHSQGSLVGMIAAPHLADAYISLNGAGRGIDKILYEQLNKQIPQMEESFSKTLTQLKNGEKTTDYNPMLYSIFRPSVQPFLIDWMQYNPAEILSKFEIPVLIIGGTKDIQVSVNEAKILHESNPKSKLVIIENMNHIFKEVTGDDLENQRSYMNPDLPIMKQLADEIVLFLNK